MGKKGSGCGSVGRAVVSDTRGPRFESSHQQKFINIEQLLYTVNCVLKRRKIKKKRPGMAHFLKKWEKCLSSMQCWDLNLSLPPITTRPGLPPKLSSSI